MIKSHLFRNLVSKLAPIAKVLLPNKVYVMLQHNYYASDRLGMNPLTAPEMFLKRYSRHIDASASKLNFPKEVMASGEIDLEYLKMRGLKPKNTLFEFGVGYFRSSIHFVEYLNSGNFSGNDISAERIAVGLKRYPELLDKEATFLVTNNNDLEFEPARKYDFIYSSTVICHMPIEDIKVALKNIGKNLMHKNSVLYFNYSVLDFPNFLFTENLGIDVVLDKVAKAHQPFTNGALISAFEKHQGADYMVFGGTNFFHSRDFIERIVSDCGFTCVDDSSPVLPEENPSYYYTRTLKAWLK